MSTTVCVEGNPAIGGRCGALDCLCAPPILEGLDVLITQGPLAQTIGRIAGTFERDGEHGAIVAIGASRHELHVGALALAAQFTFSPSGVRRRAARLRAA